MSHSKSSTSEELVAWRDFCRRIEVLGERILEDDYPNTVADQPEGIAHLADQVSCWLGWAIGHSDTTAPFFHRSNDLFTQWGGPNQDNVYHHARIDANRSYRVRGKMNSCEEFVMTLRRNFMHMPVWGTLATITASERGIRSGDDFEILLGGDGSDPAFTQIPEGVTTVSLREYYLDWRAEEPAVFTIECLDDVPAPPRLSGEQVAEKLGVAIQQVERSLLHWNTYMSEHRSKGVDNTFSEPMKVVKGLPVARYSFNFWSLAPDEALLMESDVPDARYWNLQLANIGWFEQIDPIHRITTINQKQAHVASDGRLHMVIAHEDPGVPNWLDSGGHHQGLITYRWFWPQSDPAMSSRVVKFKELPSLLPEDTPDVDVEARRRDVSARKEHLAWRFRT